MTSWRLHHQDSCRNVFITFGFNKNWNIYLDMLFLTNHKQLNRRNLTIIRKTFLGSFQYAFFSMNYLLTNLHFKMPFDWLKSLSRFNWYFLRKYMSKSEHKSIITLFLRHRFNSSVILSFLSKAIRVGGFASRDKAKIN